MFAGHLPIGARQFESNVIVLHLQRVLHADGMLMQPSNDAGQQ